MTMVQQLQINEVASLETLFVDYRHRVMKKLDAMKPEKLGKIASFGLADNKHHTSMAKAQGYWGPIIAWNIESGKTILLEIAYATVIAEIYDILRDQDQAAKDLQKAFLKAHPKGVLLVSKVSSS